MNGICQTTGPVHDALEFATCSCNLQSILEQRAFCKGMSWLTTHNTWPQQMQVLVRGKGMDCNIDSLECKISSVVILINLDGAKAIVQRMKGQSWDRVDLVEPFEVRVFLGLLGFKIPRELELQERVLVETVVTVGASDFLSGSVSAPHACAMVERNLHALQDTSSSQNFQSDLTFFARRSPRCSQTMNASWQDLSPNE